MMIQTVWRALSPLFLILLFREPAPEEAALESGDDDEKDIREQYEYERRDQDPGVFFAAAGSFADEMRHTDQVNERAEVEIQQDRGVLREADPRAPGEEVPGPGGAEHGVEQQQADIHEEQYAGHVQHNAAADPDAAAPAEAGAGAEMLEAPHQRLVLLPLDEAVVGHAVHLRR